MRIRIGFAVTLALVVVLALGSTGTSAAPAAAPSENAVVHWSGIAEVAIAAGRPPASSTPLAAMVHGAMYDAVAAIEGGLEPFATGVTAPPEASADAAVAQAARDVLVARVPAQAAAVQTAYDTFMASIPAGPAKDGGKAVGTAAAAGMLAMRTGDHFDDVVPYVQPTPGPGVFEPIAPTTPVDVKLGKVRPFTFDSQSKYRPDEPYELTSRRYARDVNELKEIGGVVSSRTPFQTEHARFFSDQAYAQYSRAVRGVAVVTWARPARVREAARLRLGRGRGHDDRLLGGQVPLLLLAPHPRDPACRHRREPGHLAGSDLAAAPRRQPSRVPVRPRVPHGGSHPVAEGLLRDEARAR